VFLTRTPWSRGIITSVAILWNNLPAYRQPELKRRVPVTASIVWPNFHSRDETEVDNQVAAPAKPRTPNLRRAKTIAQRRVRMEGWRQWRLAGRKKLVQRKNKRTYLTPTGLLMEGDCSAGSDEPARGNRTPNIELQIQAGRLAGKRSFSPPSGRVFLFSTCRLLPRLKSVPVVSGELSKADWFAAENLFHISSHGCSLALAIEPLEIKESVRIPLRDACR
jgi:hypothetical protein